MKRNPYCAVALTACGTIASSVLFAQGRGGIEWTTSSYDAQRTASIRTDPRLSVQTLQNPGEFGPFKFLWKLKLEHDPKAPTALTQPILLDRIIGFRGFKSIAFVGTQSETVHAIDIDMGMLLWKYHINYTASPPPVLNVTNDCPGGLLSAVSRPTPIAPATPGAAAGGDSGGADGRAVALASPARARRPWRPRVSSASADLEQRPAAVVRVPRPVPFRVRRPLRRATRSADFRPARAARAGADLAGDRSFPAATPRTLSATTATCTR